MGVRAGTPKARLVWCPSSCILDSGPHQPSGIVGSLWGSPGGYTLAQKVEGKGPGEGRPLEGWSGWSYGLDSNICRILGRPTGGGGGAAGRREGPNAQPCCAIPPAGTCRNPPMGQRLAPPTPASTLKNGAPAHSCQVCVPGKTWKSWVFAWPPVKPASASPKHPHPSSLCSSHPSPLLATLFQAG